MHINIQHSKNIKYILSSHDNEKLTPTGVYVLLNITQI